MNYLQRLYRRYTDSNIDLSKLPPDVQYEIFSQTPELIQIGRQMNREMRERLTNPYLEKICQQPITKKGDTKFY